MKRYFANSQGFGIAQLGVVLATLAIVGLLGWTVYRKSHEQATTMPATRFGEPASSTSTASSRPDPYLGWKTTCDPTTHACFKYPSDWIGAPYGGLQNPSDTSYVVYQPIDNKDQATDTVDVMTLDRLPAPYRDLEIVGFVHGDAPSFAVYDVSEVKAAKLAIGQSAELTTGNPTFTEPSNAHSTFVATPGAAGLTTITTADQAKKWFGSAAAKTCLEVLQSLYYSP